VSSGMSNAQISLDPDTALRELLEGNQRFAANQPAST
jgi:hypothetical protein